MNIIWTIVIGFVVGVLARFIKPGNDAAGFVVTTLVGIFGAVIAKFIGSAMGLYNENEPAGLIMSVLGAILVLFIYGRVRPQTASI